MDLWKQGIRRIFDKVFGNCIDYVCDIINTDISTDTGNIEFEIRLADVKNHCGVDNWNIYNKHLKITSDFIDDVIITYQNPNFKLNNSIIREYFNGNIKQEKDLILKFGSNMISKNTIPLISKLSVERYIPSIGDINKNPTSYAKTYRQSYQIDCKKLSKRSQQYISNWRVDKTIRTFYSKFPKIINEVVDINNPEAFDILDIEFEYVGNFRDLELSLISLIEFLYLAHPIYKHQYKEFSLDYQIYSILSRDRLNSFIIKPEIRGSNNHNYEFLIPENSKLYLMIYESDENYIYLDNSEIYLENFKDFNLYNFSVLLGVKLNDESRMIKKNWMNKSFLIIDIYIHNRDIISKSKYTQRFRYLENIAHKSNILVIPPSKNLNNSTNIYLYDDITDIRISPNSFYLNLLTDKCFDGTYILNTKDRILLNYPLLQSNLYVPSSLTKFGKDVLSGKFFIDKSVVKFKCEMCNNYLNLIPITKTTEPIHSLQEASNILLEAYSKFNSIPSWIENEMKLVDLFFQLITERINMMEFSNVLVFDPFGEINPFASKMINNFITCDKIILKTQSKNIIENLYNYYSSQFIPPIITNLTRHSKNINKQFYALNEKCNIFDIPDIFRNDMKLIISPFRRFNKLSEFTQLFDKVNENINENGIFLFNYINTEINLINFLYDIDKCFKHNELNDVDLKLFDEQVILIDLTDKSLTAAEIKKYLISSCKARANANNTFILSKSKFTTVSFLELVDVYDKNYLYKYKKTFKNIDNPLHNYIISVIKNKSTEIIGNDLILFIIKNISKYFEFEINVYYPYENKEIMEKLAFDEKFSQYLKDKDISNYVNIEIKF